MKTAIVLFNRDLRVHDHPALAAAVREAESVLPLFVFDEAILRSGFVRPNRVAFLLETLADLDDALAQRGSRLLTRRGDVVRETLRLTEETGAEAIFASADVSGYAQARERRGREDACGKALTKAAAMAVIVAVPSALSAAPGKT